MNSVQYCIPFKTNFWEFLISSSNSVSINASWACFPCKKKSAVFQNSSLTNSALKFQCSKSSYCPPYSTAGTVSSPGIGTQRLLPWKPARHQILVTFLVLGLGNNHDQFLHFWFIFARFLILRLSPVALFSSITKLSKRNFPSRFQVICL